VSDATTLPADLIHAGCDLRVALGRIVRRLRQGHAVSDLTLSEISVLSRLVTSDTAVRPVGGAAVSQAATASRAGVT
jgi:hypothetical protein